MPYRPFVILAAAGLAALFHAAPARAAAIIGGSTLLDAAGANQLEAWLGQGPIALTNIFTKTPGATGADFHAAADGRGATFAVMRATQDNVTAIIGGYNPQSWRSGTSGYYGYNITNTASEQTGFIFNLSAGTRRDQTAAYPGAQVYQTYNDRGYGPTFGGGHDIYVQGTLATGASFGYSYGKASDYQKSIVTNQYWCLLSCTFSVAELEVFTISASQAVPVPEPLGLSLFGLGLAGLGVAQRRRRA